MKKTTGCLYASKNVRNTIKSEPEKENTVQRRNVTGTTHAANKRPVLKGLGIANLVSRPLLWRSYLISAIQPVNMPNMYLKYRLINHKIHNRFQTV